MTKNLTIPCLLLAVICCFWGCKEKSKYTYIEKHPSEHDEHDKNQHNEPTKPYEDVVNQYEPKEREAWQKPSVVINKMGDISGKVIADIGAATGYFAFRILPHAQKVIASDIDPRSIEYIEKKKLKDLPEDTRPKLITRLATETDPNLHIGEVDVVLLVNTYIYINDRVDYFKKLKRSIKKGGMVMVVDYKKKKLPENSLAPDVEVRMADHEVESELEEAGYKNIKTDDSSLEYQYIIKAYAQ